MRWFTPFLLLLAFVPPSQLCGQTEPVEGLRESNVAVHALVGADVVTAPGNRLEGATIVIRGGVVESVGVGVDVPPDARVHDLAGRVVYPGFIDAHARIGLGEARTDEAGRGAANWNPQVQPFADAASDYVYDGSRAAGLRSQGFTLAMTVPRLGIFRGRPAVVSLGEGTNNELVIGPSPVQSVSFGRSNELSTGYPTSAMGGVALIRQTLLDADWYDRAHAVYAADPEGLARPESDRALAALVPAVRGSEPLLFETGSEEETLRALALAEEFGLSPWIRGNGAEYRILELIDGFAGPLLLPVNYPSQPAVDDPEDALGVSLTELRRWYVAPENPARVAAAGREFAFTTDALNSLSAFLPNVRKAVERGLDPEVALAALTTVPASLLGVESTHGVIGEGRVANLVVTAADVFSDEGSVREVWIDGRRYEMDMDRELDLRGEWLVEGPEEVAGVLELDGSANRPGGTLTVGESRLVVTSAVVRAETRGLRLTLRDERSGQPRMLRLVGSLVDGGLEGWGESGDGRFISWRASRPVAVTMAEEGDQNGGAGSFYGRGEGNDVSGASEVPEFLEVRPDQDFGRETLPEQPEHVVVRNATIWTMGPEGRLDNADLLVSSGRVTAVGEGLEAPAGAVEIDGTGKHVTPGLIDAHIHSGGTGGVNETGSAIVPEVRMGDVVTANNPWMYRQLAGGLTTAHLMHGSANPIGGQNVHMKMRWGASAADQIFEGAPRTVKFALGENPTRRSDRYPDTRMGVEQIIRDHFVRAREYEATWVKWETNGDGIPPRRDLRLEAIVDILNGDILVQAHSYRQDEILMLMRLAEEFDFQVKAFHHGVEAFMVAPELREHGAGAVVWTDWAGFKIEAYDASVYNARLLNEAGVMTSLHSDNSQIAARMNWEAGKMVRAGMEEEDALALVTINTARLIGIEDRVGSLEQGKDADFVIWNGNPLSQFSRAEQTWVDGRRYFDLEEDRQLRERVARDRADLIQFILNGS